jgi:hypothetical protein
MIDGAHRPQQTDDQLPALMDDEAVEIVVIEAQLTDDRDQLIFQMPPASQRNPEAGGATV